MNRTSIDILPFARPTSEKIEHTMEIHNEGNFVPHEIGAYNLISDYANDSNRFRHSCSDIDQIPKYAIPILQKFTIEIPGYIEEPRKLKPIIVFFYFIFLIISYIF